MRGAVIDTKHNHGIEQLNATLTNHPEILCIPVEGFFLVYVQHSDSLSLFL